MITTLQHRRHSAKSLQTNRAEGPSVHAGCSGGNEEEINGHSRIREEHSRCHVARPATSESMTVVVLCYDKGNRIVGKPKQWLIWQGQGDLFLLRAPCLCGGYAPQKGVTGCVDSIMTGASRWHSERWVWRAMLKVSCWQAFTLLESPLCTGGTVNTLQISKEWCHPFTGI